MLTIWHTRLAELKCGEKTGLNCPAGIEWVVNDGGSVAIWKPTGQSGSFTAGWRRGTSDILFESSIVLTVSGSTVTARRQDDARNQNFVYEYEGTVEADGITVNGTQHRLIPDGTKGWERNWNATIRCATPPAR